MVQDGRLTAGHARALIGRGDAETLAHRIVDEALNVRAIEAIVQDEGEAEAPARSGTARKGRDKDADTRAFEKELADLLGLEERKVEIKRGSGESGQVIIKYANYEQLDYFRDRLISGSRS